MYEVSAADVHVLAYHYPEILERKHVKKLDPV